MRTFLAFVMRSRIHAMGSSALFAALSLFVPPLSYVSGAIIGLATLRNGAREGGFVILGSVVMAGLLIALQLGSPMPVVVFAAVSWLPVWTLATMLRGRATIGSAVAAAGLGAAAIVVGLHLALGEPAGWWRRLLSELHRQMMSGGELGLDATTLGNLAAWIDALAPVMTGLVGAGFMLGLVLTLFLARWWHAVLDNAGGFAREFRALRLETPVAVVTLGIAVVAAVIGGAVGNVARDMLWIVVELYMFQGLAVAHGIVAGRKASVGWLVGLYLLVLFAGQGAILVLATTGYFDTWLRLRDRLGGKGS